MAARCLGRRGFAFLIIVIATLTYRSEVRAVSGDYIVQGNWTIEYLVRDPRQTLTIPEIRGNRFIQKVTPIHRGYIVVVKVSLEPVAIGATFAFDAEGVPGKIRESLPVDAFMRVKSLSDAVRLATAWVDTVAPYKDGDAPQDWESTLERGSGNCVGRAELLCTFLKSQSVSCRTVSGCLVKNEDGIFHRWVEIGYPEGVLPSEPGVTQDYVDPYHIVLSVLQETSPPPKKLSDLGVSVEITKESRRFWIVDREPVPLKSAPAVYRLQTSRRRHGAAIVGYVEPPLEGSAVVTLDIGNKKRACEMDPFGNFSFPMLPPGSYTLTVHPEWGEDDSVSGTLQACALRVHTFRINGNTGK